MVHIDLDWSNVWERSEPRVITQNIFREIGLENPVYVVRFAFAVGEGDIGVLIHGIPEENLVNPGISEKKL